MFLQVVVSILIVKEAFVRPIPLVSLFLRYRMAVTIAPVFAPFTPVTASDRSICKS